MKKKELKERITTLEDKLEYNESLLKDLVEFFERTNVLENDLVRMESWRNKLATMRSEESRERDLKHARSLLEQEGYFVVNDENELDTARMKKWLQSKSE